MGQSQSNSPSRTSSVISSSQMKIKHMEATRDPEPEGIGCCAISYQSLTRSRRNDKWRKKMIEELESLSLETWPELLINFVKKYKSSELDRVFQSDVVWLDSSSEKKTMESDGQNNFLEIGKPQSKDRGFVQTKNEFNIESINEIKHEGDINQEYDLHDDSLELDLAIKTLLDSSELLDESVYQFTTKENWMEKSFADIKFPQEMQLMQSNFDKIPNKKNPHNKNTKNVEFKGQNLNKTKQKIYEEYNNNTILQQFAANNISGAVYDAGSFDLYQSLLKYKSITNLIETHLKNESNIFYQLINLFESYFVNTYGKSVEIPDQENLILSEVQEFAVKATLDLQQFIRILYEAISLFYDLKSLKSGRLPDNETLFNRDNMINFVTSIVINENIYKLIFKLCQKQDNQVEEAYQKNLQLCKKLKPEDFGVPDAYCLNEKTFYHFKEKKLLNQNCFMKELLEATNEGNTEKTEEVNSKSFSEKSSENQEVSRSEDLDLYLKENHIDKDIFKNPYTKAIETLKILPHRRSPLHKLKTILKVIELISVAIEDFYKAFGVINSKKLDADQTLSICLYLVAQSELTHITTHCKLIERFSTTNILHSVSGYYATTLEACVNCLCAMELPQNASNDEISVTIRKHKLSLDITS